MLTTTFSQYYLTTIYLKIIDQSGGVEQPVLEYHPWICMMCILPTDAFKPCTNLYQTIWALRIVRLSLNWGWRLWLLNEECVRKWFEKCICKVSHSQNISGLQSYGAEGTSPDTINCHNFGLSHWYSPILISFIMSPNFSSWPIYSKNHLDNNQEWVSLIKILNLSLIEF